MNTLTADMIEGECLDAMRKLAESTRRFDAIVTDPPYGLGFMGRAWDKLVPSDDYWRAALEVAKPGAWLVAFCGTRTFHRLAVAIEDAGWEFRDTLCWLYSQGFPKSLDVEAAIDRTAAGAHVPGHPTEAGAEFKGYGTGLKPAWEPVLLWRAPLSGTVAENAMEHGTGALNIDGCRIGDVQRENAPHGAHRNALRSYAGKTGKPRKVKGRWPANVALDEEAAEVLDRQAQQVGGLDNRGDCAGRRPGSFFAPGAAKGDPQPNATMYGDSGGASRFFYCAKPDGGERDHGLGAFESQPVGVLNMRTDSDAVRAGRTPKPGKNNHPTVKPVSLMRWLVRLVTGPRDCVVLDPFAGSGTTGMAALEEGCSFVGIEREAEFVRIARARLKAALHNAPRLF